MFVVVREIIVNMGTPDWARLKVKGRVKDIGLPWNPDEDIARYKYDIPADYVRDGVLTPDDYTKVLEKEASEGKKPLSRQSIDELQEKAKQLNISFAPETAKDVLAKEIKARLKSKEKDAEQQKAVAETYRKLDDDIADRKAKELKAVEEKKKELDDDEPSERELIKKELDKLGVEYVENARTSTLKQLLDKATVEE